jgi:hypothetical protein
MSTCNRVDSAGFGPKAGAHEQCVDVGARIVDRVVNGVGEARDPLLDLFARERGITEDQAALRQRRGARDIGAAGHEGIDADADAARELLHAAPGVRVDNGTGFSPKRGKNRGQYCGRFTSSGSFDDVGSTPRLIAQ